MLCIPSQHPDLLCFTTCGVCAHAHTKHVDAHSSFELFTALLQRQLCLFLFCYFSAFSQLWLIYSGIKLLSCSSGLSNCSCYKQQFVYKCMYINMVACIGNKYSKCICSKHKLLVQFNIMHWQLWVFLLDPWFLAYSTVIVFQTLRLLLERKWALFLRRTSIIFLCEVVAGIFCN